MSTELAQPVIPEELSEMKRISKIIFDLMTSFTGDPARDGAIKKQMDLMGPQYGLICNPGRILQVITELEIHRREAKRRESREGQGS